MKKILFIFVWLFFVPLCFSAELVDIDKLTLKQLREKRPDIVQAIKNEDLFVVVSYTEKDEQRRTKKWTEERKDENGVVISKRIDIYTYYPSGCVDIIIMQIYDGDKIVSEKTIKHFEGIKQPIVEGGE